MSLSRRFTPHGHRTGPGPRATGQGATAAWATGGARTTHIPIGQQGVRGAGAVRGRAGS